MCYDATSSLLAWGFANAIAFYLWKRNRKFDRWNASFIVTFTIIQLLEAGIWSTSNKETNQIFTALIVPALLLQPLIQSGMGWKYTHKKFLLLLTYLYFGLLIWGTVRSITRKDEFHSYKGSHGHLVWDLKNEGHVLAPFTWLYLLGLFIPLLFMGNAGIPLIAIGAITFAYSWLQTKGKEFSSLWCFTAVLYAIVALFV